MRAYSRYKQQSYGPSGAVQQPLIARGRLQAFYSVRSVRQLMGDEPAKQQIVVELPGSGIDDHVCDHSTFAKHRDDCSTPDVCREVPRSGAAPPQSESLSDDHFSVDGTLVEAWASLKSFRVIDGNDEPPAFGRNGER